MSPGLASNKTSRIPLPWFLRHVEGKKVNGFLAVDAGTSGIRATYLQRDRKPDKLDRHPWGVKDISAITEHNICDAIAPVSKLAAEAAECEADTGIIVATHLVRVLPVGLRNIFKLKMEKVFLEAGRAFHRNFPEIPTHVLDTRDETILGFHAFRHEQKMTFGRSLQMLSTPFAWGGNGSIQLSNIRNNALVATSIRGMELGMKSLLHAHGEDISASYQAVRQQASNHGWPGYQASLFSACQGAWFDISQMAAEAAGIPTNDGTSGKHIFAEWGPMKEAISATADSLIGAHRHAAQSLCALGDHAGARHCLILDTNMRRGFENILGF